MSQFFNRYSGPNMGSTGSFVTPGYSGSTSTFEYSNSIVSKFAFVIFLVIIFIILLYLGIYFIQYLFSPPNNPYLIDGLIPGYQSVTIYQNPKVPKSITLQRSNNKSHGIEFTYSTWLFINDLGNSSQNMIYQYQHIFNKGDTNYNTVSGVAGIPNSSVNDKEVDSGVASLNNAPGLYLDSNINNLLIVMNTVSNTDINETITITDIPLKNWFHVAIRVQNMTMDVYVNGTLSGRLNFVNVPKQNYNDVNVCQNGGFSGSLSNLRYFDYALNVFEINNIVNKGPKLSAATGTAPTVYNYNYLSSLWYGSKL